MYDFPQDPKKIRARIRRYERALQREQACYGFIDDGAGKRYLLGPLYLLMGDTAGVVRSFSWFAQTFPDDSGDPLQYLWRTELGALCGDWPYFTHGPVSPRLRVRPAHSGDGVDAVWTAAPGLFPRR
jgi:hypothetical protein